MTIGDTIVAGNTASFFPDLFGAVSHDQGHNLVGQGNGVSGLTAASDQVGTAASPIDPKLATLDDYGGPTQTMALVPGGPAIGRGTAVAGLTTDERGFPLDSPVPDIGAFQSQPDLVVNTTTDSRYGILSAPGELSLRQAVGLASFLGGTQTITFDPTVFATHQTIAQTAGPLELGDTGELETITAPAAGLTISGGGQSRVFQVDSGVTASLSGLTITGGSTLLNGAGLANFGTVALTDCTVSGNSAGSSGGGLYNYGTATLTGCTVSGNSALVGGGLWNNGTATLTDCTIGGNSANEGGGVYAYGRLTLTACTVSGNSADLGGGIALPSGANSRATIGDTIVAANAASTSPDIYGTVANDRGYNLIGDGTGASGVGAAGDQVGTAASPIDPLLATLGDYGGPTPTMALLPGSPAIHTGSANFPGMTVPTIDQRGESRAGGVDIGAFESQGFTITPLAGSTPQSALITTAFGNPLGVTVTANNPVEPVDGGVIRFTAPPSGASASLSAGTATIAGGQSMVSATANASSGPYTITASAGGDTSAKFSLTNNAAVAIAITPARLPDATAGSDYSQALTASGGIGGPFTFAVTGGALPSGLTLAADGTVSGTSILAAAASFTITATGAGGYSGSMTYSLMVDPAPASQLVMATEPAGPAVVGQPFATQPVVYVEDPYHNLETSNDTTRVTVGLVGGSGPLLGMTTVTVSGGIATFAGLADSSAETLKVAFTSGALTQAVSSPITVSPAATTTSVTTGVSPSISGQSVTFTATVAVTAPGAGTPAGTVTFMDGANTLGTGTLDGSGKATYSTTALAVSSHTITAAYAGDGNFTRSSSSALTQTVNKDGTTAVVMSSANPSVLNQAISFTVTVAAAAPGSGTPAGTAQFQVDGKNFGSAVPLVGAKATSGLTTMLQIGNHTVTATYNGNASFIASTAPILNQVVNKDGTTTTLTANVDPSVFGQSVTFTATVAAVAPGSDTPTGSVTFYDGSTALKTTSLSGGSTTYTTSAMAAGSHAITAVFNGNSKLRTSPSSVLSETVNPDKSTTVVTSSANPSVFGQSVTFTAIVTANATGGGTPSGRVTFFDGTSTLGTATLSGSKATFKTTSLGTGPHTITVSYNGNGNFVTSTSTPLTQTVAQAATTSKVTSSANPSVFGQSVTFTATIKAVVPGSGTPTGTVTFLDGSTTLGTGTLSGGTATFSILTLAVGTHSITVVYLGDTSFSTSTSGMLTQTVKQAKTTISLCSSATPSALGQAVTFTATFTPVSPGSGTPTGTVTFNDGPKVLGIVTLTDATASFTTSSLTVGTHSIKVVYAGDTDFKARTSAVLKQVVNSSSVVTVTAAITPNLVDRALSALGIDERLTDALVADLAAIQSSVIRAKGSPAPLRG